MPAARAWFRVLVVGGSHVAAGDAVMVMSVSRTRVLVEVVRRRLGFDPGDRDQRQSEVARAC